ncbi:hypothetical protein [Streptomyces sp. PSKA30]|uniref:hypothetical protein n=1 Tax=Streptomyces sp. PSKA30 TaxID=2874597 RepID=UPI0027DFB325|nr:hypothetical protein [Streptomyces sp. PSKA30]
MDEKWNIFAEGDVVFMHRSWTGHGVYEASFAPVTGGGKRISSAVVEADRERYRSMGDEYDRLMLELIISAIVLGEPAADLRAGLVELTARASGKAVSPRVWWSTVLWDCALDRELCSQASAVTASDHVTASRVASAGLAVCRGRSLFEPLDALAVGDALAAEGRDTGGARRRESCAAGLAGSGSTSTSLAAEPFSVHGWRKLEAGERCSRNGR